MDQGGNQMSKKLKKGFTLIELLVVLLLMGIITTAIVMILRPTSNLAVDIDNKADEENNAITLFDYVNGKLRYATDVMIVSNDDASVMPSHGNMKNFILLSNDTRPVSKKGARGYAKSGLTSKPLSNATYCVSSSLLAENDYQFSIEGVNTEAKSESITFGALVHPMKATYSNFVVNEDKPYNYSETFQLVNMQNRDQLNTTVIGGLSTSGYDASKKNIWIFYEEPKEAKLTGNASNGGIPASAGIGNATYDKMGKKDIDLSINNASIIVHFMSGNDTNKNFYWYNKSDSSKITIFNDDGSADTNGQVSAPNTGILTKTIYLEEGSTFKIKADNQNREVLSVDYTSAKNTPDQEFWIYDWESHNAEYVPPAAINKTLTIHYVAGDSSISNGIRIKDSDVIKDGILIEGRYYNNDWENYDYYNNNGSKDIVVNYVLENTKIDLYTMSESNNVTYIASYEANSLGDSNEIWITNGAIYGSVDDIPPAPSPQIEVTEVTAISNNSFSFTIKNTGLVDCKNWEVVIDLPDNCPINSVPWNVTQTYDSQNPNRIKFTSKDGSLITVGRNGGIATISIQVKGWENPALEGQTPTLVSVTATKW